MSDNVRLDSMTGGDLVAADDVGGTKYQRVKVTLGAPGVSNGEVSAVNPLPISSMDALRKTYSASIRGLVPAAVPTDIFTIIGSASKVVRVTQIVIGGTQTVAGAADVTIVKRSTADTGGTPTSPPTPVPHDSTNPAATAVVAAYTANPTLGTGVGTMKARKVFFPASASVSDAQGAKIDLGIRNSQAGVLRGVAELLAVNLAAVTLTGGNLDIDVEWTEE